MSGGNIRSVENQLKERQEQMTKSYIDYRGSKVNPEKRTPRTGVMVYWHPNIVELIDRHIAKKGYESKNEYIRALVAKDMSK